MKIRVLMIMILTLFSCVKNREIKVGKRISQIQTSFLGSGFKVNSHSQKHVSLIKNNGANKIEIAGRDSGGDDFQVSLSIRLDNQNKITELSKLEINTESVGQLVEGVTSPIQIKLVKKQTACIISTLMNRLKEYDKKGSYGKMNLYINILDGRFNFDKFVVDTEETYGGLDDLSILVLNFQLGRYENEFLEKRINEVSQYRVELQKEKMVRPTFLRMDAIPKVINCGPE